MSYSFVRFVSTFCVVIGLLGIVAGLFLALGAMGAYRSAFGDAQTVYDAFIASLIQAGTVLVGGIFSIALGQALAMLIDIHRVLYPPKKD